MNINTEVTAPPLFPAFTIPMINLADAVFVFGSNLAGIHGAGAALVARRRGFPMRLGVGPGPGRCYALPTKDERLLTLPLHVVRLYVKQFVDFAAVLPKIKFQVTRVGCGLAGFQDEQIAPLFLEASFNCMFDRKWKPWLPTHDTWGTYE